MSAPTMTYIMYVYDITKKNTSREDYLKVYHCRGKRKVKALMKEFWDRDRYQIIEDDEYFDFEYSKWNLSDD